MTSTWTTGEQHEIAFGDQTASITEVGATLRAYGDGKGPLVDGFERSDQISAGRGQVLLPWPNRIRDGRYEIEGITHQLPLSEPKRNNASHGLLRWVNWSIVDGESTESSVTLSCRLHPQPGYPFAVDARVSYALSADGLEVRMTGTNVGDGRAPFGMGSHPYVTAGTTSIDGATLTCPATTYQLTDEQAIPTVEVAATDAYDFRSARSLDGVILDTCFGGLLRDSVGRANVDLLRSDTGEGVRVWMDEAFNYVMVFTADAIPVEQQRRRSVAIEPMTCAPDAFNNGMGVQWLEPGHSLTGAWGIARV